MNVNTDLDYDLLEKRLKSPDLSDFQESLDEIQDILSQDPGNSNIIEFLVKVTLTERAERTAQWKDRSDEIASRLDAVDSNQAKTGAQQIRQREVLPDLWNKSLASIAAKEYEEAKKFLLEYVKILSPNQRTDIVARNRDKIYSALVSYLAYELDEAIFGFTQYLKEIPHDYFARNQLQKATSQQSEVNSLTQIPRDARIKFRRARSLQIAGGIGNVKEAKKLVEEAIELAEAQGKPFPDAENTLNILEQDLLLSKWKQAGLNALREGKWAEALEQYSYVYRQREEDEDARKYFRALQDLLKAKTLLDNFENVTDALPEFYYELKKYEKTAKDLSDDLLLQSLVSALLPRLAKFIKVLDEDYTIARKIAIDNCHIQRAIELYESGRTQDIPEKNLNNTFEYLSKLKDEKFKIDQVVQQPNALFEVIIESHKHLEEIRKDTSQLKPDIDDLNPIIDCLRNELQRIVDERFKFALRVRESAEREVSSISRKHHLYSLALEEFERFQECPFINHSELDEAIKEITYLKDLASEGKHAVEKYAESKERPPGGTVKVSMWLELAKEDGVLINLKKIVEYENKARTFLAESQYKKAVKEFLSGYRETQDPLLENYVLLINRLLRADKMLDEFDSRSLVSNSRDLIKDTMSALTELKKAPFRIPKLQLDIEGKLRPVLDAYDDYLHEEIVNGLNDQHQIQVVLRHCEDLIFKESHEKLLNKPSILNSKEQPESNSQTYDSAKTLLKCIEKVDEAKQKIHDLHDSSFPSLAYSKKKNVRKSLKEASQCTIVRDSALYRQTKNELDSVPLASKNTIYSIRVIFGFLLILSFIVLLIERSLPQPILATDVSPYIPAQPIDPQGYPVHIKDLNIFYAAPPFVTANEEELFSISIRSEKYQTITATVGIITSPNVPKDNTQGVYRVTIANGQATPTKFKFFPHTQVLGKNSEVRFEIYVRDILLSDGSTDNGIYYFAGPSVPVRPRIFKDIQGVMSVISVPTLMVSLIVFLSTFVFGKLPDLKGIISTSVVAQ